ncbi:MAG: YkvA family protein [Saprospiraceae bacterium]
MMKNPFQKYASRFSEKKLFKKLGRFAKQAGIKTAYSALLMYYAFTRRETPAWARSIIIGVLGYFINPIDWVPDLTPFIGFTDDLSVLGFGLVTIACFINDEVRIKARKRMKIWFGELDLEELAEIDAKL